MLLLLSPYAPYRWNQSIKFIFGDTIRGAAGQQFNALFSWESCREQDDRNAWSQFLSKLQRHPSIKSRHIAFRQDEVDLTVRESRNKSVSALYPVYHAGDTSTRQDRLNSVTLVPIQFEMENS
jgi:hypothetical protein